MLGRQSGSSMLELMIAVAASIMLMSALMSALANVIALGKAKREGAMLADGAAALDSYLKTQGVLIVNSGIPVGFIDPLNPTYAQLKAGSYLPSFAPPTSAFGGTWTFTIRKGVKNDLFGLVCDTQNITEAGAPSPQLAGEVVMAANGSGLRTSIVGPTTLNGPGFTGIASPINGPAIVCAWAYLANPV